MRKIVVLEGVTVNGIFDAETMGQWAAPYYSDKRDEFIRGIILASDVLLLGRKTYDLQAWYWPNQKNDKYGIANHKNQMAKYVVTSTVGVIVLTVTDEGFLIDNVAVDPSYHGKGIGRALLEFAEASTRRAGFNSIYLYTHEKMMENLALYSRIGYVEYDRRSQGDFSLVYMRKRLE